MSINFRRIKFTYVKATLITLFVCLLFLEGYVTFEKTGENFFHVFVNGVQVGTVGEADAAEKLLIKARKNVASQSETLTFMDVEMSMVGEEVLWGEVDSERQVQAAMEEVLRGSVIETMQKAYTLKVNEYMVNLANMDQVKGLLQAAVDKYDSQNAFQVELCHDTEREFNVLTANVNRREGVQETSLEDICDAGVQAVLSQMGNVKQTEETAEMSFEDFELGLLSVNFAEEVEIVEAYLPESQLTPLETAIEDVIKEQEMPGEYEVVAGDTLSEIAIKVNIPMDKIIEMNSETLENENSTIRIGDKLIITVPEPELSVERTEKNYYEEIYDADIIYVDNDSWYTTQTKVLQQPSAGFRKVVANVFFVNDKEVSREILKEEIVMEAVPKIVERGTKIPPTYIKPISGGRQSSGFGKRNAPTKGASTYHKGIDWAVPKGTAVFASCGGTVARAGWGSGYGYVVYINHSDGRQTRYAHLSKVLVKVGQRVDQGQRIALSGNTGISSGPHLHFEMLIGGKQVNPLKYLQ
ncbi:MAG: LysM peptidoglycan-binding domain-containing protein [Lachnospiraceae bacterium]|nr:LysM peptidoglycan-binding domain-containing protein [Lachnospiraceae bacterium]